MFGRGRLKWAAWALLVAIGVSAPLLLRIRREGQAELDAADAAAAAGRVDLEIVHLGRAARWRAPIVGHDEAALRRLMAIGADAEAQGEAGSHMALLAYREARAALLATRARGLAEPEIYAACNGRIATLMAAQERVFGTDLSGVGEAEAYHQGLLAEASTGDGAWGVVLGLLVAAGVWGWRGGGRW